MGIFARKRPPISTDGLLLDQTWDDPPLDAAYAAVRHGDLSTGLALLKASPINTDQRSIRMVGLARAATGQSEALELRLRAIPGDADLLCWLTQTLVFEAWQARGQYEPKHVSQQQLATFRTILGTANDRVTEAIDAAPEDGTPWICLQWIALGLEFSLDDQWLTFRNALARQPDSYLAHARHVQTLAPKWSGRPLEELLHYGHQVVNASQPGRALGPGILSLVLSEVVTDVIQDESLTAAARETRLSGFLLPRTHLLTGSITRWWNADHHPEAADLEAHQAVAFALRLLNYPDQALHHATLTQGRISHSPWYLTNPNPLTAFATATTTRMRP